MANGLSFLSHVLCIDMRFIDFYDVFSVNYFHRFNVLFPFETVVQGYLNVIKRTNKNIYKHVSWRVLRSKS